MNKKKVWDGIIVGILRCAIDIRYLPTLTR